MHRIQKCIYDHKGCPHFSGIHIQSAKTYLDGETFNQNKKYWLLEFRLSENLSPKLVSHKLRENDIGVL